MTMQAKECRNTTYLNDNAQTPLNRFAVYMLYSKLCNKYSDKSNTRNLGLSLSEATSVVHTKMGHVSKTMPLLGEICHHFGKT